MLELTFAEFIRSGGLDRHLRKVLRIYEQRRDLFCRLLARELGEFLRFEKPKGGMAIWCRLDPRYAWKGIFESAGRHRLEIAPSLYYPKVHDGCDYLRIGFAEHNEAEIRELVKRLKAEIRALVRENT